MSAFEPVTCQRPPPTDTEGWAIEVAAALEAIDSGAQETVLPDGTRLEPDDAREAVLLEALRVRGCDCSLDEVEEAVADLAELETEIADLDAADDDLPVVALRYLAAHTALGIHEDLPDPTLLEAVTTTATKLVG